MAVIDTDIQSPGIHMPFALTEECVEFALNHFIWGECEIEKAAYDVSNRLPRAGGPLHLVPSSMKISHIGRILKEGYDVRLLNDGFQALIEKLELDYLFVDTHPGVNEETLLSIAISDTLVLILRPRPAGFSGDGGDGGAGAQARCAEHDAGDQQGAAEHELRRASGQGGGDLPRAGRSGFAAHARIGAARQQRAALDSLARMEASREMKKVADRILAG